MLPSGQVGISEYYSDTTDIDILRCRISFDTINDVTQIRFGANERRENPIDNLRKGRKKNPRRWGRLGFVVEGNTIALQ